MLCTEALTKPRKFRTHGLILRRERKASYPSTNGMNGECEHSNMISPFSFNEFYRNQDIKRKIKSNVSINHRLQTTNEKIIFVRVCFDLHILFILQLKMLDKNIHLLSMQTNCYVEYRVILNIYEFKATPI